MRFKAFWHNDFRVAGRQQLADFATLPTFSFDGFDGAFPPKPDILFSPKQPRNATALAGCGRAHYVQQWAEAAIQQSGNGCSAFHRCGRGGDFNLGHWHEGELALTRLTWNQRNHKA